MNKAQLVEKVAEVAQTTKVQVETILDSFLGSVQTSVAKGNEVKIVGFGTFAIGARKARMGRNPQSGETIKIPAKKVPKFRSGKEFKDALNSGR